MNVRRTTEGYPDLSPTGGRVPTPRAAFVLRCRLVGIHDRETVDELWRAEHERRTGAKKKEG